MFIIKLLPINKIKSILRLKASSKKAFYDTKEQANYFNYQNEITCRSQLVAGFYRFP